ncbi:MAG: acyl dehydratase [Brevundimonas sp.]|nr:acyl dehydratase [Brevundimonas sp.]
MSVSEDVRKDWDKATAYTINDEDLERAKLLLDIDAPSRQREYITQATPDNIRNFALGAGNDNPLHTDPAYAAKSRWGGLIAPNLMMGVVNAPMNGPGIPGELKAATKGVFRGVHVFVSGAEWLWYRPMFPGDTLYSIDADDSQEVKTSEFAGRSVTRIGRRIKVNQRGEVVAVYRTRRILTERKTAKDKGKYSEIKAQTYTDEDLARIDEIYAAEQVRGAEPRWFEDVKVGDSLGKMAKGPLTVTDVMVFHAGGYGFVPYAPTVGRLAWRNRQRIPAFYVKNEYGVPDVAQRLHWDNAWAQQIGNPMAYDYAVMRENYVYHYLTDWAGDDAFVTRQYDEIRKFNYVGDTQIITGEVVAKREEDGLFLIDVKIAMANQRGEETVRAEGTIALPSRTGGVPKLPTIPDRLQQKAYDMMRIHWAT